MNTMQAQAGPVAESWIDAPASTACPRCGHRRDEHQTLHVGSVETQRAGLPDYATECFVGAGPSGLGFTTGAACGCPGPEAA